MLKEFNEIEYEKTMPQKLHGNLDTLISLIANVVERLRYTNPDQKPGVTFEGDRVKLVVSAYKDINPDILKQLREEYTQIFKRIFEYVKEDLDSNGMNFEFCPKFLDDKMDTISSRGFHSRSYLVYYQWYQLEIISKI